MQFTKFDSVSNKYVIHFNLIQPCNNHPCSFYPLLLVITILLAFSTLSYNFAVFFNLRITSDFAKWVLALSCPGPTTANIYFSISTLCLHTDRSRCLFWTFDSHTKKSLHNFRTLLCIVSQWLLTTDFLDTCSFVSLNYYWAFKHIFERLFAELKWIFKEKRCSKARFKKNSEKYETFIWDITKKHNLNSKYELSELNEIDL